MNLRDWWDNNKRFKIPIAIILFLFGAISFLLIFDLYLDTQECLEFTEAPSQWKIWTGCRITIDGAEMTLTDYKDYKNQLAVKNYLEEKT